MNLQKQRAARFWTSNAPIKALTFLMLATFWIRSPSKIKFLCNFNTRSRHAFPIAMPFLLLVKSSITKQAYSHFQGLLQDLPPCNCSGSQLFLYPPCGHIVTGDLNIARNIKLRDLLNKGPKYREPDSYSWHQYFGLIMDACEEYVIRWAKKEDVEVNTLSEWVKSIADVLKCRIRQLLKH